VNTDPTDDELRSELYELIHRRPDLTARELAEGLDLTEDEATVLLESARSELYREKDGL
jgi:predicted transcriptional regulator